MTVFHRVTEGKLGSHDGCTIEDEVSQEFLDRIPGGLFRYRADDEGGPVIPDGPGKELGGAGGGPVHQHDHRLVGERRYLHREGVGPPGRGPQVPAHQVGHVLVAQEIAQGLDDGAAVAAGVAPQVHHPAVGLLVLFQNVLLKIVAGVLAEAGHLQPADMSVHHLAGGGGKDHLRPGHGGLQLLPVQAVPPILHQPLGVAVKQGEVGNRMGPVQRRQVVQMPGQVAEDAVDHPAGPGILTQLLGEGHGLAHRSAHGNFGEEEHLVQPQPEAVAHLALHFGQFHGGVLLEVVVQQHPVLQHSKAQAGGQGGVPPVQMGFLDDFFQMAVGPGLLMVHGNQSLQRSFPGRHALVPSFLSLGGFIR